jgi:hypothetical protein
MGVEGKKGWMIQRRRLKCVNIRIQIYRKFGQHRQTHQRAGYENNDDAEWGEHGRNYNRKVTP